MLVGDQCTLQGYVRRKTVMKHGRKPAVTSWQRYWVKIWASCLAYYPPKSFKGYAINISRCRASFKCFILFLVRKDVTLKANPRKWFRWSARTSCSAITRRTRTSSSLLTNNDETFISFALVRRVWPTDGTNTSSGLPLMTILLFPTT